MQLEINRKFITANLLLINLLLYSHVGVFSRDYFVDVDLNFFMIDAYVQGLYTF